MIRIVVADDHQMVIAGIRMICSTQPDFELVAEASNGREAVDACLLRRPDVCLLDIRMPVLDGLGALKELQTVMAEDAPAVVMVTTFDVDEYVYCAFKAGARGFITKDGGSELVVSAIRAAAAGDGFASPAITRRLIEHFADQERMTCPVQFTQRELEVVRGVAMGLTNAELAERHFVSISTTKTHIASVLTKVGARNRVELTVFAFRYGLMDTPPGEFRDRSGGDGVLT